jgi:hypothetical protein
LRLVAIDLFLFTACPTLARTAVAGGVTGVVVDWENRGKERRQAGEGTEVNAHTPADLAAVRAATAGRLLCRVDAAGPHTAEQVDLAVRLGADEVLLPMVRRPDDVDLALAAVARRCGLGILVETQDAVEQVAELAARPLSRVYLGLNDLRIDRGSTSLFAPLVDGTADDVAQAVRRAGLPFGVAGLTRTGCGSPVPTRLLAGELARLDAGFTFLRRSFLADVAPSDMAGEVPRMREEVARATGRDEVAVELDRAELRAVVGAREPAAA